MHGFLPELRHNPAPGLSIVIPAYNSEQSLPVLLAALDGTLPHLVTPFEVILVNDGSRDKTWQTITNLVQVYPWLTGINLMRNYGQHNALLTGIRVARYATLVTMDDDLEHPPAEIRRLLNKLDEGFDVVYGTPQQQQHGLLRNLASTLTKTMLQTAMGIEAARNVSAFRAFRTYLRDAFVAYQSPFVSIDVLLTWGTTRFTAVEVQHSARQFGVSNYTFRKLITHAFNLITGLTTWPLQIASWLGFGFTAFGILIFIYVIVRYLLNGGAVVPGFSFLASVIAIFSGIQLFVLGMIGEYLARMHIRLMNRPTSVTREMIGAISRQVDDQAGAGASEKISSMSL